MRIKKTKLQFIFVVTAFFTFSLFIYVNAQEQGKKDTVDLSKLPEGVRMSIQDHTAGSTIKSLETVIENGNEVYYLNVKYGDNEREIKFDSRGQYINYAGDEMWQVRNMEKAKKAQKAKMMEGKKEKKEEAPSVGSIPRIAPGKEASLSYNDLPNKVKKTLANIVDTTDTLKIELTKAAGIFAYVITGEKKHRGIRAKITEKGEILSLGQEINKSKLSAEVISAINKSYPNAKIEKAYETKATKNKNEIKYFEVKIFADEEVQYMEIMLPSETKKPVKEPQKKINPQIEGK